MRLTSSLALSAVLALGACATARDAEIALPEAYPTLDANAASAGVLDAWWLSFGDPELNALIDEALTLSPDAQSAAARLQIGRAHV